MRILLGLACLPFVAVPAFADCVDDIRAVMAGLGQAGPLRMVATVQTKAGTIAVVSEKVPGAMHSLNYANGTVTEYTVMGDRAWSKTGDDWSELPAETAAGFAAAVSADSTKTFDDITDAECLGIDTNTFLTVYRLTYREAGALVRAEIETSSTTGLPRRLRSWTILGGEKSIAVTEFTYDPDITVISPL